MGKKEQDAAWKKGYMEVGQQFSGTHILVWAPEEKHSIDLKEWGQKVGRTGQRGTWPPKTSETHFQEGVEECVHDNSVAWNVRNLALEWGKLIYEKSWWHSLDPGHLVGQIDACPRTSDILYSVSVFPFFKKTFYFYYYWKIRD